MPAIESGCISTMVDDVGESSMTRVVLTSMMEVLVEAAVESAAYDNTNGSRRRQAGEV